MTLNTPQYPEGRDVILISNDITYQIGSFGPSEDILFKVFFTNMNRHIVSLCLLYRKHQRWHVMKAYHGYTLLLTVEQELDWLMK